MKIFVSFERRKCEMHNCLRNVMRLCRWAGVFPVEGLGNASPTVLKFNLRCVYSIFCVASILGQAGMSGVAIHGFFTHSLNLPNFAHLFFYASSLVSCFFMVKIAKHWTYFIRNAEGIENKSDIQISKNTSFKTNMTACFILFWGLVEHVLSVVYQTKVVTGCLGETEITYRVIENLTILRMPYIFKYTSFAVWKAFILEIINVQATFIWNFMDVMIICISIYVTEFFKELNKIINSNKMKTASTWEKIRSQYSCLVALVKEIDDRFSHCVLLCISSDLFFICLQLFNTLEKSNSAALRTCDTKGLYDALHGFEHMLYFSFSFVFLIGRVLALSYLTANVNTVAQKPNMALGTVPASVYNITIQRFHRQLNYTPIGISGVFFYVTRQMILNVFGTIVTYELVLLQFNRGGKSLLDVGEYSYVKVMNSTLTVNKEAIGS